VKFKKSITVLAIFVLLLAAVASYYGIFSKGGPGKHEFKSLYSQNVQIHGTGLYKNDSVSIASQAVSQDIVTLFLGVPLLIISMHLARKGSLRGRLLLAGTLGYFLYTYASYSFYSMYNPFFLINVLLMSLSFFAFTLTMMSFDHQNMNLYFSPKLPVKFVGGFLIFVATAVGLMWIGKIVPPLLNGTFPLELEHYTTLVIQALDLGFVAPTAILSGVLLMKRSSFGYLLSSVIIIKEITMLSAITAMLIGMMSAGVKLSIVEIAMFPLFNLIIIYCLFLIMKNIIEPNN
jgi:hypothetical protein